MNFTGLDRTSRFNGLFDFVKHKASMNYWKGKRRASITGRKKKVKYCWKISTIAIRISTYPAFDHDLLPKLTRETQKESTVEQEFVLVMLKLRIDLLIYYLSSSLHVSDRNVSQIFTTWVKLLSKNLTVKETSYWNFTWPF